MQEINNERQIMEIKMERIRSVYRESGVLGMRSKELTGIMFVRINFY
jgi:hypothetical protein